MTTRLGPASVISNARSPRWAAALWVMTSLWACAPDDEDRNVVVPPGGGPPGGGSSPDAAPPSPDADPNTSGTGRVCLLTQLRNRSSCRNMDADGISVTWDDVAATTTDNGSFSAATAPAGGDEVTVSGGGAATSVSTVVTGAPLLLPAVTVAELSNIASSNDLLAPLGTGGLVVYVVDSDGLALSGYDLVIAPGADNTPVVYDSAASATIWTGNGTGPGGAALALGLPPGAAQAVISGPGGSVNLTSDIVGDRLRFVVVTIP